MNATLTQERISSGLFIDHGVGFKRFWAPDVVRVEQGRNFSISENFQRSIIVVSSGKAMPSCNCVLYAFND